MLGSTKAALAVSAARAASQEATTAYNGADEPTAEQTTAVETTTAALQAAEKRHATLLTAEAAQEATAGVEFRNAGDSGEANEIRSLRGRVSVARYLGAAANDRALSGAEAEFNAALALPESRNFPLELLAGDETERRAETDAVNSQTPRRWIDRLFGDTAAAFVGVTFDSVAAGEQVYTVTTAGGTPAQRGRQQDAPTGTWTIGTTTLTPARMSSVLRTYPRGRDPAAGSGRRSPARYAVCDGRPDRLRNFQGRRLCG